MGFNKGMMTSKRQNWRTPLKVYNDLHKEFKFDFDPCMFETDTIHKADMLGSDWGGERIYVNPPYNKLADWIKKCYKEHKKDKTVVMLIPVRTDTKAFHEYIYNQAEIRFIKGRLKFKGAKNSAPFPSMIVVFRKK